MWDGSDLSGFLLAIESHSVIPLDCAMHCQWVLWCTRNAFIFQGHAIEIKRVVNNILAASVTFAAIEPCRQSRFAPFPSLILGAMVGFFDGTKQKRCCGAGMVILLDTHHYFRLRMGVGRGTNSRAELLALWGLLFFVKTHCLILQQILGDSRVIIDWAMKRGTL